MTYMTMENAKCFRWITTFQGCPPDSVLARVEWSSPGEAHDQVGHGLFRELAELTCAGLEGYRAMKFV